MRRHQLQKELLLRFESPAAGLSLLYYFLKENLPYVVVRRENVS